MEWLMYVLSDLVGYILGNFSFAYIYGKIADKRDIRDVGSGNAGTTNMMRTYGKKVGFATFFADALKGVGAVLLGRLIAGEFGGYIGAVMVIIGHIWPVLMGFRGGKGIATTAGLLLTIYPLEGLVLLVFCLILIVLFKYVSVASLVGCLGVMAISFIFAPGNIVQNICFTLISLLCIFSHRENIKRLIKGNENKLIFSKLKP